MKQFYSLITLLFVSLFSSAQNFEYSIQYIGLNGGTDDYQAAIYLTPDFNGAGELSDAFVTLSVPAGATVGNFTTVADPNASGAIPAGQYNANTTAVPGSVVVERDPFSGGVNPTHTFVAGTPIELFRFDVQLDPNPTSGTVTILTDGDANYDSLTYPNYVYDATSFTYYQDDGVTGNLSNGTNDNINFATLSTQNNTLNELAIYPNPVKNVLNIKGLDNTVKSATIFNVTGQKVISQTTNLNTINTSALTPGIYFLNLETENTTKTVKLIKQ